MSQVAPSWCLHSSTCQFMNRIPKARNLPGTSDKPVSSFGLTVGLVLTRPSLPCAELPAVACRLMPHSPETATQTHTDVCTALPVTVTVTVTLVPRVLKCRVANYLFSHLESSQFNRTCVLILNTYENIFQKYIYV